MAPRGVTFRMPSDRPDDRPVSPTSRTGKKPAAPRKPKVSKEKAAASTSKKEEKGRSTSPKGKKRSSRIQSIAIDPSPNMSMAVLHRTEPQGPPEGFEEFDQQQWLREQMELQKRFASMYNGSCDDDEDDDDDDGLQGLDEEAQEQQHQREGAEAGGDSVAMRAESPPEWAQHDSASEGERSHGEESDPEPEFAEDAAEPSGTFKPQELATGRDQPSPVNDEEGGASPAGAVDVSEAAADDDDAEATLRSLLAAAAAASAAAAPAPTRILTEDDHRKLKAKRRPPPRSLLADEGGSPPPPDKESMAGGGVGASGLFDRTGPLTPRKGAGGGASLAAEVAALSESVIAAYSPSPGHSWS
jgi:hypothetical protein